MKIKYYETTVVLKAELAAESDYLHTVFTNMNLENPKYAREFRAGNTVRNVTEGAELILEMKE